MIRQTDMLQPVLFRMTQNVFGGLKRIIGAGREIGMNVIIVIDDEFHSKHRYESNIKPMVLMEKFANM